MFEINSFQNIVLIKNKIKNNFKSLLQIFFVHTSTYHYYIKYYNKILSIYDYYYNTCMLHKGSKWSIVCKIDVNIINNCKRIINIIYIFIT